jgi:hypothetical protein
MRALQLLQRGGEVPKAQLYDGKPGEGREVSDVSQITDVEATGESALTACRGQVPLLNIQRIRFRSLYTNWHSMSCGYALTDVQEVTGTFLPPRN